MRPVIDGAGVAPKHFVGDGLQRGVRQDRSVLAAAGPDRGQHDPGPFAGVINADGAGLADDLPDATTIVLAMDEVAPVARGQYSDAEALELAVANIVCRLAGLERVDTALIEAKHCHWLSSCVPSCSRGQDTDRFRVFQLEQEEKSNAMSVY